MIGSLFPRASRADTTGALVSLCNDINNAIDTVCNNNVRGIVNCDNALQSTALICGFVNFTIDPTAEALASDKAKADAQTIADDDTDLATAVAAGDTVSAIQDICNSMQLFIEQDCDDSIPSDSTDPVGTGACLMFESAINNACLNAILANET